MLFFQLYLLIATDSYFFGEFFITGSTFDACKPYVSIINWDSLDILGASEENQVEQRHTKLMIIKTIKFI